MKHSIIVLLLLSVIAIAMTTKKSTMQNSNTNQKAPVYCTQSITVKASPEKVWNLLTDVDNWTKWNSRISRAELEGKEAATGTRFAWKVNGAAIKSVFHTVEKNHFLGWSGTTFGGSAIHNWQLKSEGNTTTVIVEESMEGWLVSLFKKKMNKDLQADMQHWLTSLKSASEQ